VEDNTMVCFIIKFCVELQFLKQVVVLLSRCEEINSFSDEHRIKIRISNSTKAGYSISQLTIEVR
jgi:hypothetical protein